MLFTFVVAATASQALGLRPRYASSVRSAQFAKISEFAKLDFTDPSKSATVLQEVADVVKSMGQEGNATDHLDASDTAILEEAIRVIKDNMYGSMQAAHGVDIHSLDDHIEAIKQCYMDFSGRVDGGDIGDMYDVTVNYQVKLDILQDDVDAKTTLNNSAWDTLQSHISMISNAPTCPHFPDPRTMLALDVYFDESPYSTWWIAQKAAYEPVRAAWWAAHLALQQALTAYAVGLAVRDVSYCDWKRELEAACARYGACYDAAKDRYFSEEAAVAERVKSRINNFKAGETIIHNIRFLLALEADQEVGPIATDEYHIAYPDVPEKRDCDMSALDEARWVPTPKCGTFMDLGAGCCSPAETEGHHLFNGKLGDFDACKAKCRATEDCAYIIHGWQDRLQFAGEGWCSVISSQGTCDFHRLNNGRHDCGTRGDNGVHSFRFVGR